MVSVNVSKSLLFSTNGSMFWGGRKCPEILALVLALSRRWLSFGGRDYRTRLSFHGRDRWVRDWRGALVELEALEKITSRLLDIPHLSTNVLPVTCTMSFILVCLLVY